MLADVGAEVIKIEYPRRMDGMRGGRKENQAYNHHPRWKQINRNKLSITLDLHCEKDRETVKGLIALSQVIIESSRPGVMAKFGLDFGTLRAVKPDLIYVSMSAFGQSGSDALFGGYGGSLEALSGIQVLTNYLDGEQPPIRIREIDVSNGVMGACAIMTALVRRQHTGEAQYVDLSQLEAMTSGLFGEHLLSFLVTGRQRPPHGNRDPDHAPQGCYPCKGENQWVTIAVSTDGQWNTLCSLSYNPEAASDPRFRDDSGRQRWHDEIDRMIADWTRQHEPMDVVHMLQQHGIAAGPVLSAAQIVQDEHVRARAFITAADDGSGEYPGSPFLFSEVRPSVRASGPALGADNERILCGLMGKSKEEVAYPSDEEIGTAFDVD
jgi:crotonobetainyl-CoA:carnitine CoA-transferase CaiB-like acyl-CoA transferase